MKLKDKNKGKEPIKFREMSLGVAAIGMREEKPKKKLIYRKLKKQSSIISFLAIFVIIALTLSWLSLGVESRAPPPPERFFAEPIPEPMSDPIQTNDFDDDSSLPEKLQPEESGISGQLTYTYHI